MLWRSSYVKGFKTFGQQLGRARGLRQPREGAWKQVLQWGQAWRRETPIPNHLAKPPLVPVPQKLCKVVNICCLNLLSFGVLRDAAT